MRNLLKDEKGYFSDPVSALVTVIVVIILVVVLFKVLGQV